MSKDNIYTALLKFHSLVGTIVKGSENPFHKNKYADLSTIQKEIDPHLQSAGLVIIHLMGEGDTMSTVIVHSDSGTEVRSTYNLHSTGNKSQDWGSAITYAKRYALGCMLNLCIDVDDDGNKSSGHGKPRPQPHRQARYKPQPQPQQQQETNTSNNGAGGGVLPEYVKPHMTEDGSIRVLEDHEKDGWLGQRKTKEWQAAVWLLKNSFGINQLRQHWRINRDDAARLEADANQEIPF